MFRNCRKYEFDPDDDELKQWMPLKFNALATYNSEVARGLVHTDEWKEQMRTLQQEFDDWKRN